tara:strand:+ start:495 stop:1043 length:549 start_codon:yes stop_codon:yes gene_type:complete
VLPAKLPRGRPSPEEIAPWLELVEELLSRGISNPSQLRNVLGIGYKTAERWLALVKEKWTATIDDDRVNWRRERLYREADAVAQVAWMDAMQAESVQERTSCFKVVIEANKRKASLCGLDKMELKIESNVKQHIAVDVVASVETDFGLAPGALSQIGRDAALLMSAPVIDAEVEASEEETGD